MAIAPLKDGCLLCGKTLCYGDLTRERCSFCQEEFSTQVRCVDGHYLCDRCHQGDALTVLERFVATTPLRDPVAMVKQLFRHPSFHMHGPEHHFLIPAVTLRALENLGHSVPEGYWELVKNRASQLPGGTCGYWGACSAGIGAGVGASIFAGCSPLRRDHYDTIHRFTSAALTRIAQVGGPRCCKRNLVLSLESMLASFEASFGITLEAEPFRCEHFPRNRECLGNACPYFPKK